MNLIKVIITTYHWQFVRYGRWRSWPSVPIELSWYSALHASSRIPYLIEKKQGIWNQTVLVKQDVSSLTSEFFYWQSTDSALNLRFLLLSWFPPIFRDFSEQDAVIRIWTCFLVRLRTKIVFEERRARAFSPPERLKEWKWDPHQRLLIPSLSFSSLGWWGPSAADRPGGATAVTSHPHRQFRLDTRAPQDT